MGYDPSRIKVTYGGVGDGFGIKKKFKEREDVIGYVGSFAVHKRVGRFLKERENAQSILKQYRIELHGSKGVQLHRLQRKYDNRNGVKFCGSLGPDRIVDRLNSFKAFVSPTAWESYGLPIIEAVACGVPVFVYSDSQITPEVKRYAVEIGDISEIPLLLEKMNSRRLEEASLRVRDEFSWDRHFEILLGLYRRL